MREIMVSAAKLRDWYAHETVREICQRLGIQPPRLYKILDQAGIPRKLPRVPRREITRIEMGE